MGYVHVNGRDLYTEISGEGEGEGEPVLVLHGGFCSLESLAPIAEALAAEHRVYAYERPGHGRSADIAGDYSYERGVTDALAFLDAHELSDAHVVGYSDGAIIGLMLAMQHPARVRSLAAISANLDPSAYDRDPAVNGPILPDLPVASSHDAAPQAVSAERSAYARLSPDGPAHIDVVWDKCVRLWTTEPHIDPAELASATSPTLIISGDRDTVRPLHSLRIAAALPNARLGIVPGTDHGLVNQQAMLIADMILAFYDAERRSSHTK